MEDGIFLSLNQQSTSLFRSVNDGFSPELVSIGVDLKDPIVTSPPLVHSLANDGETGVLDAYYDNYGGVVVDLMNHQSLDSDVFATLLRASLSLWKQQGKKGVWIKLPVNLANLVEASVEIEGFWYHHAEATYIMLVYWIPEIAPRSPANASGGVVMEVPLWAQRDATVDGLVEMDQGLVEAILKMERTWKNPELFNLVDDSLRNSSPQINLYHVIRHCLNGARYSQFKLEVGLRQFDEVKRFGSKDFSQALQEIEKFKAVGDPFGNEFSLLFQPIYGKQMIMLNKLQAEKIKLDKKLRSIKGWRKLSNVLFVVSFTSVLICSVVAAATAAQPVLTALAGAASVPIGSMGKWVDTIYSKYENEVKAKLDFIGSMEVGTFIIIKDLDNIQVLVDKLESKMDALLQNADFALKEGEAVELALDEIKKELSEFTLEIEDLSQYADKFSRDVARARTTILQKMIAYPSA